MGKLSFIADTFGDAVMVVDVEKCQTIASISLGPMPSLSPQERGELLFFDGRLSVEGWMSCHSCHTDGHTNGLLSDTLGDGSYGAPKRIPTLRGVGDTAPWAWNGSMERLEDQVSQSIRTTMHGSRPSSRQVADLIAYLRSLTPPPLPQPLSSLGGRGARDEGVKDAVRRGAAQFQTRGCVRCHAAPTYTTPKTYDVGLEDELGKKLFNPPSLRGVRHGVTFFHDGRATSLREVFSRYHHQIPADMPRKELDDLLTFLHSL
jgi:cytochrome c peroxidase